MSAIQKIGSVEVEQKILEFMTTNSGLDQHRDYLGISKISDCPRRAFREYHDGPILTPESHVMCYAGYQHEREIMDILINTGIAVAINKEVISPFDNRLRGHIDGLARDGSLLEIKSVNTRKFEKLLETGRALFPHYVQVQLYMRYGHFARTLVVYRNRETYGHIVMSVRYVPERAEEFETKAKLLLQAIDENKLPACECRHCHD
jgi:hypothetical protein